MNRYILIISTVVLLLALAGCSGSSSNNKNNSTFTPVPTLIFHTSNSQLVEGEAATLTWQATNATTVTIDNGMGDFGPTGSVQIAPKITTTYTATAKGSGGSTSQSQLIKVIPQTDIGYGNFKSLGFGNGISQADQDYITALFQKYYPAAVTIFGQPPDHDATVLTIADGTEWGYQASTHTLTIVGMPTTISDPVIRDFWHDCFLHVLTLAMILSEHTGVGSPWIRDAYSYAGTHLIRTLLGDTGVSTQNELDLDIYNLAGKEIVGGAAGRVWRGDTNAANVDVLAGAQMFEILQATQSNASIGDWASYTALKSLRAAQYAIFNANHQDLTDSDFRDALHSAFGQSIEGVLPDEWVFAQPLAYTTGTPGTYLYAYAVPAANPKKLQLICFIRSNQQLAGAPNGTLTETPCTSGTVNVAITTVSGPGPTIPPIDLSGSHTVTIDTTGFPFGSYRIRGSGTVNGVPVTVQDSYFGLFDSSSLGTSTDHAASVMFLIGKNLSTQPILAPTGGAPGKFLQNTNGVAIWQVNATNVPLAEYMLGGRRLYAPMPFSPVFVIDNP